MSDEWEASSAVEWLERPQYMFARFGSVYGRRMIDVLEDAEGDFAYYMRTKTPSTRIHEGLAKNRIPYPKDNYEEIWVDGVQSLSSTPRYDFYYHSISCICVRCRDLDMVATPGVA